MATSLTVAHDAEHNRHQRLPISRRTLARAAIVFLVFLPFVGEALYGLCLYFRIDAPSGARLVRAGVTVAGLAVLLWRPLRPLSLYVWTLCGLWVALFTFWSATSRFLDPLTEVVAFFQLLYGFLFLAIVYDLSRESNNVDFLISTFLGLTTSVAILIVLSFYTEIGLYTYGDYTFGTKSFFAVGNGIGFLLVSGLAISCMRMLEKYSWIYFMISTIHMFACIFFGSATSILGGFIICIIYFTIYIFSNRSYTAMQRSIKVALTIFVGFLIIYVGVKTHQYINRFPYMLEKLERIIDEGPRGKLIESSILYLSGRKMSNNVYGEGVYSFQRNFYYIYGHKDLDIKISSVEVDPIDIYGAYGLIFTILVYIPYILLICLSFRNYNNSKGLVSLSTFIISSLAVVLSFITGHIVNIPTSTTVIAIIASIAIIEARRHQRVRSGDLKCGS